MAPVLSDAVLKLGSQAVAKVRRGAVEVWIPGGGVVLPAIGSEYGGGFFAGLYSATQNGIATHAVVIAPVSDGAQGTRYFNTTNLNYTDSVAFCASKTFGGFTDWRLPSLPMAQIAYVNLKPANTVNDTTVGANSYEVPIRGGNYTASDPAQTPLTFWQRNDEFSGPSGESFARSSHWTNTGSPLGVWGFNYANGSHLNLNTGFTNRIRVRAFRLAPLS